MKVWTLVGSGIGVALTLWLLSKYGFDRILSLVVLAGWAIPVVAALHLPQIVCSGAAWHMVTEGNGNRQPWRFFYVVRWIREGINNLLPVAQFGGVVVGARLLVRHGVGLPQAVAGATVDTTFEFISHIIFTLIGLGLLFASAIDHEIGAYATAGIFSACAVAVVFLAAQWFGIAKIIEWAAERLGKSWGWNGANGTKGLHQAIVSLYRTPRRIAGCFLFHLLSWTLGALEIYVSFRALGHEVNIVSCLIIEALAQAMRSAGFAVPGALGVQEGGYILAGGLFGLPPEVGIAVSLIKRLRDVLLGLPALAAWHWLEGRPSLASPD